MIIGVPKEIKAQEYRIGAVPAMLHQLVQAGHQVVVEAGSGLGGLINHNSVNIECPHPTVKS